MIAALRERVAQLLDRGLETGLQVPQDTGLLQIDPGALSAVLDLLDGSIDLLADVAEACEGGLAVGESDATLPPEQLGDLAFVARSELVEIRGVLQTSIDEDSKWQIAAQADRAAGRSVRALLPVESALREYEGLEPIERVWFDLDDTLEIRRRFVRFWLEVQRADTPAGDALRSALERIAMMIADLRQDPIYPFLRLDDRLDLRALQKRILRWLDDPEAECDDGGGPEEAGAAGGRLWQDASGFFNLLMQIQRREELRERDLVDLGRALRRLQDEGGGDGPLERETYDELRDELLGMASREADLDAILLREKPVPAADLESAVRKLHEKLLHR